MGKKYLQFCLVLLVISIPLISSNNMFVFSSNNPSNIRRISSSGQSYLEPDAENTDYLETASGTGFNVTIYTVQLYESYTEYFVYVTVQLLSFGTDVDRIYDIYFDLSLVWSGGYWNTTIREIPEINTIGGFNYTIFGIALNEGDFGSLANNEEVSMTLYYDIEVTEGIILGPDETSVGHFSVFGITYRNIEATPVSEIYDVTLPPVYSNYETKMGLSVKTNAEWTTNKYWTVFVRFTALEFPYDVDRFHHIQFQLHFKYSGYDYVSSVTDDLEIAFGETTTYDFHLGFSGSDFGGLSLGEEITVQLWYEMYYKEGVILAIDPEYTVGPRYIYDITLENSPADIPVGDMQTHNINLDTSIVLTHTASKSIFFDWPNIWLNFTLYFNFNIYIEMSDDVVLESYSPDEITNMDPYIYYLKLIENNVDVDFGVKPEFGVAVTWINKANATEYSFEVDELPVPTLTDVDGDGSYVDLLGTVFYLWDAPLWYNYTGQDTYGYFMTVQDGITIDIAGIELLQYIAHIHPILEIADWLLDLSLVFAIHINPIIFQILAFNTTMYEVNSSIVLGSNHYLGFLDFDTTDIYDAGTLLKKRLIPYVDSFSIELMPRLLTYAFSEVTGSLDIELKIKDFELFQFPLINLVSSYEDSYYFANHPSESFTRYTNFVTPTPTPTPSTPPSTPPSDTETPTIAVALGLLIPVLTLFTTIPVIIYVRRKKKEY